MRIAELQTRPLTEAAPTPNTIITEKDTIIAQQVSASEAELYVTDEKGKVLKVKGDSSSSGTAGAGTASPQTLSQVLTAGNDLDGKEINGDLIVKHDNGIGGKYSLVANTTGLDFEKQENRSGDNYESYFRISDGVRMGYTMGDTRGGISKGTVEMDPYGFNYQLNNDRNQYRIKLEGNFEGFKYENKGGRDEVLSLTCTKGALIYKNVNDQGEASNLSFIDVEGLSSSKYYEPTKDEQYVQKKYVDSLLGGGKIDVAVDRMYLTYAGKLAVDITINGLPGHKVSDPNLFDHSTFRMKVATLTGSNQAHFTFGPTGNATIEKTYMYNNTGTVKAHIEAVLPPSTVDKWGESNPRKDIFNQTQGFFVYIPEAGMPFSNGVRSRMTHYGEVYDKRQSGVVNFKLQDGKQSALIHSTDEYQFFTFDADTFKAEDPIDSTYSYFINNGIPIGSQDVQSGYILSNNRIMPNPTPNQVTDWELTIKLGGADVSKISNNPEYTAVVYDSENNPLEHVHLDIFTDSEGEPSTARAKFTTVNKFKNIVGNGRGFKFGIRINRGSLDLNHDTKFELVNIKRTSNALV